MLVRVQHAVSQMKMLLQCPAGLEDAGASENIFVTAYLTDDPMSLTAEFDSYADEDLVLPNAALANCGFLHWRVSSTQNVERALLFMLCLAVADVGRSEDDYLTHD